MPSTTVLQKNKQLVFTGIALLIFLVSGAQNPFNTFLKDSPDGESLSRYDNGDTSAYFTKVNGNVTGVVKEFYPNKRLKYILYMKDGLCVDTARWFLKDGRPETILFCRNDTVFYGETRAYKDSVLILKHHYRHTGAGVLLKNILSIGVEAIYIDLDKIAKKENVVYLREAWYHNKLPAERSLWLSGKRDGEQLSYFESGKLASKKSYNKGVKDGTFESYDKKGNLLKKTCYTAGKETPCN